MIAASSTQIILRAPFVVEQQGFRNESQQSFRNHHRATRRDAGVIDAPLRFSAWLPRFRNRPWSPKALSRISATLSAAWLTADR